MSGAMRMTSGDGIRVRGLDELHRALKQLDGDLPKELRAASKDVATDVASEAKGVALSIGGVAAKVAPSIKPRAGVKSAGVGFGGSAYPFALGAAFGGQGRPTTQQFKPHLGTTGYFPYPTIRANAERIEETYLEHVEDLMERAGLK